MLTFAQLNHRIIGAYVLIAVCAFCASVAVMAALCSDDWGAGTLDWVCFAFLLVCVLSNVRSVRRLTLLRDSGLRKWPPC